MYEKYCTWIPASLHVRTELYSCLTWSSRSFSMRSQIILTCLKVKMGMSFLCGERALNKEVDEDPEGRSKSDDWEEDSWGGDIFGGLGHPGYCNCFLLCILFISWLKFVAICSKRKWTQVRSSLSIHFRTYYNRLINKEEQHFLLQAYGICTYFSVKILTFTWSLIFENPFWTPTWR